MSFIPPYRTKIIKHGTISKTIRGRSFNLSTCFHQYSAKQLAKVFAQSVNNRNDTIPDNLIFAMCMLKRQLTFSSSVFVSHWLKHLDSSIDSIPLVAFHRLASQLTSILPLSCLIQQADNEWICSQCRMLLQTQQIDILADYLEAMMAMGDPLCMTWLNRLCANDRNDHCSCRPVASTSMLSTCLQVLQDPRKIATLSMDKRRDIVMQFMQQAEDEEMRISNNDDLAAMKKQLWQGAMRWKDNSLSHLLASWYAECGSLEWSRLSHLLLTQKPTLSLLLIYIGACQQLQHASHLARATELFASLNTFLNHIISRGLPRQEFQMLLMLVQICLSYLNELLGMTYQAWFQHNFVDAQTTCFQNNKRAFESFIKLLEEMVPIELPVILQVQGKVVNSANQQVDLQHYVSMVKTRLMELGVDHTLRHYPTSLQYPLQNSQTQELSTNTSSVEDIIEHAMDAFDHDHCIPKDLWEDAIFKPRWFKMTFLPALIVYPHRKRTRDSLIAALHDKKKIPPNTYKEYLRMQ